MKVDRCPKAVDETHEVTECNACQEFFNQAPESRVRRPYFSLKNAWEVSPEKDGMYFVIDHCNKKRTYNYCASSGGWWNDALQEPYCPTCLRFQWMDTKWRHDWEKDETKK